MASLLYGLVCLQVTWCWEAPVTLCALEWNLLSGSSHGFSSKLMLRSSWCTWMAFLPSEIPHVPSISQLLAHFGHLKSFSPVWALSSFFKLCAWENVCLQLEHWNSVSSVLVLFKWSNFEKFLAHLLHFDVFCLTNSWLQRSSCWFYFFNHSTNFVW